MGIFCSLSVRVTFMIRLQTEATQAWVRSRFVRQLTQEVPRSLFPISPLTVRSARDRSGNPADFA